LLIVCLNKWTLHLSVVDRIVIATIHIHEAFVDEEMYIACNQLATTISEGVKELIIRLNTQKLSKADIQLATTLATKSRQYFDKAVFKPAIDLGLIVAADNEPLHSPKTKYQLTKLGLALLKNL